MTTENKEKKKQGRRILIPLIIGSVSIVFLIGIFAVDFDGSENKWKVVVLEQSVMKKEGYIQNSEFNDGWNTIYGTFGNPLGIFKETIFDEDWKFQKGRIIVYTETTIMPKCESEYSLSIMWVILTPIDRDYRECVKWTIEKRIELK